VSTGNGIKQLAELRQRREKRALDLIIAQNERCRIAEQRVVVAAAAAAQQLAEAQMRERRLLDSLVGHIVGQAAVATMQLRIERFALETANLLADVSKAEAELESQRKAYAAAEANFHVHRKASEKLTLLVQQQDRLQLFRDLTLAEVEDEDRGAARAKQAG